MRRTLNVPMDVVKLAVLDIVMLLSVGSFRVYRASRQAWMMTGVPRMRMRLRRSSVARDTRRHPALAELPIEAGLFVPWMASWLPPRQPAGRWGWMPEIPWPLGPARRGGRALSP